MEPIVNKVATSALETFDLASLWDGGSVKLVDISEYLDGGFILREKTFRQQLSETDFSHLEDCHVGIVCSTDALIPVWAYMYIASLLSDLVRSVTVGGEDHVRGDYFTRELQTFDWEKFRDKPVVVKGCANEIVPDRAYALATEKLTGVAKKIMFGEPCSTIPLWRQRANRKG